MRILVIQYADPSFEKAPYHIRNYRYYVHIALKYGIDLPIRENFRGLIIFDDFPSFSLRYRGD